MRFIEERTYTLHIGMMPTYLRELECAMPLFDQFMGKREANFTTEVGGLNQIISYRSYENWEAREACIAAIRDHPTFPEVAGRLLPMISRQENRLLKPTGFSPIR